MEKAKGWRTDGRERAISCELLSLSVHSIFYLTRQPFHTLHKEMRKKNIVLFLLENHPAE